jgi:hypothetical protein
MQNMATGQIPAVRARLGDRRSRISVDVSKISTFRRVLGMRSFVAAAVAAALMIAPAAASARRPTWFAVSSETACLANKNINPFLRANHANVLRLILAPQEAPVGAGIGCIEDAYAAGFKVYISLQFNNHWSPSQVAAYVRRVLPTYAPYVWAVGVGNEQDLSMTSAYGQGTVSLSRDGRTAGQSYRAVWNVVEPVLVKLVPHAVRVYGEFSPWGFAATEEGFVHGRPPGVQAIAAHCYHTTYDGLLQVPQDAAWAASKRLPLWCSEMGPAFPRRTKPKWAVADSWGSWNVAVGNVVARSPDLKMWGYYYDPAM